MFVHSLIIAINAYISVSVAVRRLGFIRFSSPLAQTSGGFRVPSPESDRYPSSHRPVCLSGIFPEQTDKDSVSHMVRFGELTRESTLLIQAEVFLLVTLLFKLICLLLLFKLICLLWLFVVFNIQ